MISAAIYARKSNEQNDVAEEQKSVNRQIDDARAFILAKGWTLAEGQVYSDDGVSGALFTNRPAFQRLMHDAAARAFDCVVFYDLDRFGRNARQTMHALNTLADLGIAIWDYSTGQALDLDSFEGETMTFMKARFAQQERDQGRKRTRDSMRRKASQGLVTGGKVFGYDNHRVAKGQTIRVRNEAEARIVREIYTRAAAGEGAFTIAEFLNRTGEASPRAQLGRPNGWSVSTVREVLKRPLYRGEVLWGKTASRYGRELGPDRGTREKGQRPTPPETWTRLEANDALRIIDPDLAAAVDARRLDRRTRYLASLGGGGTTGRMPEKAHGKYLLSGGMLVCPTCGGPFEGLRYPRQEYVCSTRRRKPGACTNKMAVPMAYADEVVLDMLEGETLSRKFIEELLSLVEQGEVDDSARVTADRDRLRGEVANLVQSIAMGVSRDTVAADIRDREAEIARLEVRLRTPRRAAPKIEELREALNQRAEEWKATLRAEPKVARLLIRRLIGPLLLPQDSPRPDFIEAVAEVKTGLLDGLDEKYIWVSSPRGLEPRSRP